jgi:hypothetical protein
MSESLQNMASSYVAKGRTVEFEKMSEYVDKLSEKIRTMEKIGQRIQKERTGITTFNFFSQSQLMNYAFFTFPNSKSLPTGFTNGAAYSQPMAGLRTEFVSGITSYWRGSDYLR